MAPGEKLEHWLDRPVLVTGASGLVGSWLVPRLVEAGADVVALVRDWVPQSQLLRSGVLASVKVVSGDVRDQALLERTLGEYEVDTVFHLAAQTIVGVANRNPVSTFETNIGGTWSVLEATRRSPTVRSIVVASSDKAYGDHGRQPYIEGAPLVGSHPYDVSKSCAYLICTAYAKTFGTPVVVTRCGNFFGGGDLNWNRIVPGTIRSALRGQSPVIRSDGQFVRDYFYVQDGAAAYMLAAERLSRDANLAGEAFNFSNEAGMTVVQLAQRILDLMGSKLQLDIRNEATNEIRHQRMSSEKARRVLGWEPLFGMDEALARTVDWYRSLLADNAEGSAGSLDG